MTRTIDARGGRAAGPARLTDRSDSGTSHRPAACRTAAAGSSCPATAGRPRWRARLRSTGRSRRKSGRPDTTSRGAGAARTALGEGGLARGVRPASRVAKQHVGAVLDQGDEPKLRVGARCPGSPPGARTLWRCPASSATSSVLPSRLTSRHRPVPGASGPWAGDGVDHLRRAVAAAAASPPACGPGRCPTCRPPSPERSGPRSHCTPFEQTTQHLPVGRLHVQRQGDHVVDHHVGRQVPLPPARGARGRQHRCGPSPGERSSRSRRG